MNCLPNVLQPLSDSGFSELEEILRNFLLIDRTNRKGTLVWLATAIGRIDLQNDQKKTLLLKLLPTSRNMTGAEEQKKLRVDFVIQLLLLIMENRPQLIIRLIWKDDILVRRFFSDDLKRAVMWFDHFSVTGDHALGARALSKFAFAERDRHWQDLAWTGKHPQSPVSVAAKPYYFCELDVKATVENFLYDVPLFWKSDELWESLEGGTFLSLDSRFFALYLFEQLYGKRAADEYRDRERGPNQPKKVVRARDKVDSDDSSSSEAELNTDTQPDRKSSGDEAVGGKRGMVERLIEIYVEEEEFSVVCERLLHLVGDDNLLVLLTGLAKAVKSTGCGSESRQRDGKGKDSINQTKRGDATYERKDRSGEGRIERSDQHKRGKYERGERVLERGMHDRGRPRAMRESEGRKEGSFCTGVQDELAAGFRRTLAMTPWSSVDNVLLYVACSLFGRQALKLLREEENEHVAEQIEGIVIRNRKNDQGSEGGWPSGSGGCDDGMVKKEEKERKCLRMAISSWNLRHELVRKTRLSDEWENILKSFGIGYEKFDCKEKGGSGSGRGLEEGSERKKERRKRKKEEEDFLLEYKAGMSVVGNEEGWRLSIDGYTLLWDKTELGDLVADVALSKWLRL